MNTRKYAFASFLSLLLVLSLACSSLSDFTATATPLPTSTFTPIPPTATPAGPVSTTGNLIVASMAGLELSGEKYIHPTGFVSFYPMKDWEIYETDFSVAMTHPETSVGYYINVNNTGYPLNAEEYATFRNNAEEFYKSLDNYVEMDAGSNEAIQLYYVNKNYTLNDAEYYTSTIYQQIGSVIYTMEMYGETQFLSGDEFNPYRVMFDSFLQTIEVHSDIASEFPLYQQTWNFTATEAPATIAVPWTWAFETNATENGIGTFFYSPDGQASAGLMTFTTVNLVGDTGKKIGLDSAMAYLQGMAGEINTSDVQDFQPGGAYAFRWESPSSGQSGVMIYDIRVKNKLILVVLRSDQESFELYRDLLATIGDSYTLEQ